MNKLYLYLLSGIASVVKLGRRGNTLRSEANHVEFRDPNNNLLRVKTGNAQQLDDAVSLQDLRDRALLNYGAPVQGIPQLLSIVSSERRDKQIRYVEDERTYYQFDAESIEIVPNEDNPNLVFIPNDLPSFLPGRWIQTRGRTEYHTDLLGLDEGNDHPQYQLRNEKNEPSGYPGIGVNREIQFVSGDGISGFITSGLRSIATSIRNWTLPDESGTLTTQARLDAETNARNAEIASLQNEKSDVSHTHTIGNVTGLQTALNAKADLVGGFVPANQLPSYVDDVLEFADLGLFPGTGETGKIYIALNNNRVYRWSGSAYMEIVASPGSSDSIPEGNSNLYFTDSRVRSVLLAGLNTLLTGAILASDSILQALGKLQNQISNFSSGVMNWIQLLDTPASYGSNPKRIVQVNSGSNGLEFGPFAERQNYIDDPYPTSNAILSKWFRYVETGVLTETPSMNWTPNSTIRGVMDRGFWAPIANEADYILNAVGGMPESLGIRYSFSIEKRHLGKVLQISFDFERTSAITHWKIYIVQDPLNANGRRQLIEPVNTFLALTQNGIVNKHIASFQTHILETNYAFVIHSSGTTPGSIAFNNLRIWEPTQSVGAVITDWVSYSPTFNGSTPPTNNNSRWRRVGSNAEILGTFELGTITGGQEGRLSLPPGLFVGTLPGIATNLTTNVGNLNNTNAVSGNFKEFHLMATTGDNFLRIGVFSDVNYALSSMTQASSGNFVAGNSISFRASVPIAGWGSTIAMSSDGGDGRVVACKYSNAILSSTVFNYQTLIYDTHNAYSSGIFTAPVTGIYRGSLTFRPSTNIQVSAQINESTVETLFDGFNSGYAVTVNFQYRLLAGQRLRITGSGGGGLNSQLSNMSFSIENLSTSNQQIGAMETVACRYTKTDSVNITTSLAIVNYNNRDYDTHGSYSNGEFTAPVSGLYQINVLMAITSGSMSNLHIQRDGVNVHMVTAGGVTGMNRMSTSTSIRLVAGQKITILGIAGANTASDNQVGANVLSIFRVGI